MPTYSTPRASFAKRDSKETKLSPWFNHWLFKLTNDSSESDYLLTTALQAGYPSVVDSSSDGSANRIVFEVPPCTYLWLCPYGTNAENEEFNIEVRGWAIVDKNTDDQVLGMRLWEGTCKLASSTAVGASSLPILNTHFLCKTVTKATTDGGIVQSVEMDDTDGSFIQLANPGFPVISIEFNINTAATCNCLVGVS
jgi:hypothetical protein